MIKKSYNLVVYDVCCAVAIICAISLPIYFFRASYASNYYLAIVVSLLRRVHIFLLVVSLVVVISPLVAFVARFGFNQGLRLFLSKKAIQEQLLDNRTSLLTDDTSFVRLPAITIVKDKQDYLIKIANNLALTDTLSKLDLSTCLMGYRQDGEPLIAKDHKHYIYRIYDMAIDYRFIFNDYNSMWEKAKMADKYKILIDDRLTIDYYHTLIVGKTGSGKSYFMYYLILQHLAKFGTNNIYIIDPKDSDLYNVSRRLPQGHGCGSRGLLDFLKSLLDVVQQRKDSMADLLYDNPNKDYRDFDLPPIMIVFDEFLAVKMLYQDSKDKKLIDNVVGQIVAIGRQIGVFLIIGLQKSPADVLPSSVRSSMIFRVLLGNAERTDYITTFEQSEYNPEEMEIGTGHYQLSKNGLGIRILKTPTLNFDVIEQIIKLTNKKQNKKRKIKTKKD